MLIFSDMLCIKQIQCFAVSFLCSQSSTVYFQSSCVLCFFILNRLLLQTSAHLSSKSFCSFLRKSGQNPSWIQTKRTKHVDSKRIKPAKTNEKMVFISFYCILLNYCTHKTFRKVIGLAWTGCSVFASILTDFIWCTSLGTRRLSQQHHLLKGFWRQWTNRMEQAQHALQNELVANNTRSREAWNQLRASIVSWLTMN